MKQRTIFLLFFLWAPTSCAQDVAKQSPAASSSVLSKSQQGPPKKGQPENSTALRVPPACKKGHLPQRDLKTSQITIETYQGPKIFSVELCLTNRQRQIGMMCRHHLADNEGMLFIFNDMRRRSFWMKNTLIPLDMLFIDDEGRIVGLIESATPLSLDGRSPRAPAKYVLELAGGQSRRLGIKVGQWIDLTGLNKSKTPQ